MSSSLTVVIPLSLPPCCAGGCLSSQHSRGLPAGGLRPRSQARVGEQKTEGVRRPNGPLVSGLKAECQPFPSFPCPAAACPRSGVFASRSFCRSAGHIRLQVE